MLPRRYENNAVVHVRLRAESLKPSRLSPLEPPGSRTKVATAPMGGVPSTQQPRYSNNGSRCAPPDSNLVHASNANTPLPSHDRSRATSGSCVPAGLLFIGQPMVSLTLSHCCKPHIDAQKRAISLSSNHVTPVGVASSGLHVIVQAIRYALIVSASRSRPDDN